MSPFSEGLLDGFGDGGEAVLDVPTGWALVGARVAVKDGAAWFRGTVGEFFGAGAHAVSFDFDGKVDLASRARARANLRVGVPLAASPVV